MAKFLVVGLQSFNFKDDTGKNIKGNNMFFLDKSENESFRGLKTGKVSIPDSLMKAFTVLPGFYDLDFSVKVGAGGKSKATVCSVEFISGVTFAEAKTVNK